MKTTKKDFELFKEYCAEWQQTLGLVSWKILYEHSSLKDKYAECHYKVSGRAARIVLATSWDREINEHSLRNVALHECLHLLLARLLVEAEDRYTTQYDINTAEETIVVTLENVIGGVV